MFGSSLTPVQATRAGATAATRAGLWSGLKFGLRGSMLGLPLAAYDASMERRGEQLPTLAGRTVGLMTLPAMAGAISSGLMLVPGMQPVAMGVVATLAALYPNARFAGFAARGFRKLAQLEQNVRRLEMGGRYQDSVAARAARASAVEDMNAALVASRRFLGQEALFLHR